MLKRAFLTVLNIFIALFVLPLIAIGVSSGLLNVESETTVGMIAIGSAVAYLFFWGMRSNRPDICSVPDVAPDSINAKIHFESATNPAREIEGGDIKQDASLVKDEFHHFDHALARECSCMVSLRYVDGSGNETDRTVHIRKFEFDGPKSKFFGFCKLRGQNRTFLFERVLSSYDATTGEIIEDLPSWLSDHYHSSIEATIDRLLDCHFDLVSVAIYLGRADGALRKGEREVIARLLASLTGDERIDERTVKNISSFVEKPTTQKFKVHVGKAISASPRESEVLLKLADDFRSSKIKLSGAERDALEYISERHSRETRGQN